MSFRETVKSAAKIVGLATAFGFGGGFLWGLADHRSTEAIQEFASHNISIAHPENSFLLVFSCKSEPLVEYDLLSDEILTNRDQIKKRMEDRSNAVLASPLFSHASALAVEGFGVFYSLKDELKLLKSGETTLRKFAFALVVALPAGYVGYKAAERFAPECSSGTIYQRLKDREAWAPFRAVAARQLYENMAFCVDRNSTLVRPLVSLHGIVPSVPTVDEVEKSKTDPYAALQHFRQRGEDRAADEWRQTISPWRAYISRANDAPEKTTVASRYVPSSPYSRGDQKAKITWGDSIFQRLYGVDGFVRAQSDFDKSDFQTLLWTSQQCEKLDASTAKELYRKVVAAR